eukprot:1938882-Alexandrium_andersonii.AAC.1
MGGCVCVRLCARVRVRACVARALGARVWAAACGPPLVAPLAAGALIRAACAVGPQLGASFARSGRSPRLPGAPFSQGRRRVGQSAF